MWERDEIRNEDVRLKTQHSGVLHPERNELNTVVAGL